MKIYIYFPERFCYNTPMTDIQKFYADVQRILKHDRAEHSDTDGIRTSTAITCLFEKEITGLGSIPRETALYWLRRYIEQSPELESEPTASHIDWLAGALSLLQGDTEGTEVFTAEDWKELKDIVNYEAEVIPLETLSQLMSIFLAHGVI